MPLQLDDYSVNVTQMQTATDPGGVGSESLATSLAGEIERLRFVLKQLGQGAQWYSSAAIAGLLGYSRVQGQTGNNNTTTPNTQYDFAADAVVLRASNGGTVIRTATGTVTNNVSTAGPAANGRDQAGAFSASSWIHFYWIWNGTTLATLSSAVAPITGPTLPTGYTHWAYIGANRFDGASALVKTYLRGSRFWYDVGTGGVTRVLSNGVATAYTNVGLSAVVPPNVTRVIVDAILSLVHNAVGTGFTANLIPSGSALAVANVICAGVSQVAGTSIEHHNIIEMPVGTSSQIAYRINTVPATSGGVFLDIIGYAVPNGDA